MPSGYGRESNISMFHGGTMFRDSASKVIHVKIHVSLGASETQAAKLKFKEWLWEVAMAKVRHYHSDNGIFVAKEVQAAVQKEFSD